MPENGTELVKSLMTEEQRAHMQDYFKVTESDEFREFLKTNPTLEERFHFLSDRGIGDLPRNLNMLLFRKSFPTGEPADFEPEMHQKLTQMLITGGVVPIPTEPPQITSRAQALTPEEIDHIGGLLDQYGIEETVHRLQASDPALAEVVQYRIENAPARMEVQEIIREFWADKRTFHWQMGYFKGNISGEGGSYEWSQEVLAQVASPRAAEPAFTETSDQLSPIQDERFDVQGVPAGMEPTDYEEPSLPTAPPAADLEQEIPDDVGSEEVVNLAEMFTEFSKQFTEESFETTLREKFSPKRLEKSMQLLNRYGPKEGLRRLKESDPEVAKQVERHIRKAKEE